MPANAPDPDAARAAIADSPVDVAVAKLDRICRRYDETLLELAEDTYADLARGVGRLILPAVSQSRYPSLRGDGYFETVTADSMNTATCYVARELASLKRALPGSVFSELPPGRDAYELTADDATLRLKFGQSHEDRRPIDTPYTAVDIAVPTTEAYVGQFYAAMAERVDKEDGTHFNADG